MKTLIAVLDKSGENAVSRVVSVLTSMSAEGTTHFGLSTPERFVTTKKAEDLSFQNMNSNIVVGYASTLPEKNEVPTLKSKDATVTFEGRMYPEAKIGDIIEARMESDCRELPTAFLKDVEGDFYLLVAQNYKLLALRDPVGVQPLYFGGTEKLMALGSNRKVLWQIGIEEPKSFPPGHLGIFTREEAIFEPVEKLAFNEPKSIRMQEATIQLRRLLENSVRIRVSGQKKVAVAFSGGLDSSIIAYLAKKCDTEVSLIHVSLEEQTETEEAKKAAEELDLPLQVCLFKEIDLKNVIAKVVELIEEPDPIMASVGVPFYWNAQKAAEEGFRVLLAGQGADELFGGYQRYINECLQDGETKVRRTMFHDVAVIHESNIERDEKICSAHNVELRLPFASFQVAQFAVSLPIDLKIERKQDSLRKLILRKTAENIGLPKRVTEKPKKAAQYSTGINNALKKLAKKQNCTLAEFIDKLFLDTRRRYGKSL